MSTFNEQICAKFNITEQERDRNAHISGLFQNAVVSLSVGTSFYITKSNMSLDMEKMHAWDGAYKLVLDLIARGDFEAIIELVKEEGKEYPCDPTPQSTRDALIYVAKFFQTVYTVWLTEQETSRVVPVAKFLEKMKEPVPPYYTNWIRSDYEYEAYYTALAAVTRFLAVLDEATFTGLCSFLLETENIQNNHEARAIRWLCQKYMEAYRYRYDEKQKSLLLAGHIVDNLVS